MIFESCHGEHYDIWLYLSEIKHHILEEVFALCSETHCLSIQPSVTHLYMYMYDHAKLRIRKSKGMIKG